ncbi:MAG: efflux RND transporter permease subunit, partial [Akkermansia sp.]
MSKFFIKHPIIAMVISIVMVLLGGLSMMSLPVTQYPDIVPPTINLQATYPGADAQTVADSVASPIEQNMSGVDDMEYMYSTNANNGVSKLSIVFEVGTDPNMDQTLTYMRYAQSTAQLPAEVSQMGVTLNKSASAPLALVSLYSPDDSLDAVYLANYAYVSLVDPIKRIKGVGDVQVFGSGRYAMRIWLDTTHMAAQNISIAEVRAAIVSQNTVNPSGQVGAEPAPPGQDFTYTVRTKGRLMTPEQFGNIIIRADGSNFIYLKDIAKIELGSQTYSVAGRYNGKATGAVAIYQSPGTNAITTVDNIKKEMETLEKAFPNGLKYKISLDTTLAVRSSIEEIKSTIIEALLLVIIVVFVFLQGWRATLIPAIAVPVSIIGTFAIFPLIGFSLNTICLMGMVLAIGLVVDDAIVVVEAVEAHMDRGLSPRQAAFAAMEEVSGPVIAIALVLAAVFLPSLLLPGITGTLFQQFAVTIAISM